MKYLQSAVDMELFGSDVFGDASRDSLSGSVRLGAFFAFAGFAVRPWGRAGIESSDSYTIVRLIEPGSGFPQDTGRFMDVESKDAVSDFGAGIDLGWSGSACSCSLSGYYAPSNTWTREQFRYCATGAWTLDAALNRYYFQTSWSRRDEAASLDASKLALSGAFGWRIARIGITVGAFCAWSAIRASGLTKIPYVLYYGYKDPSGATAESDLPVSLIALPGELTAHADLANESYEAGFSCALDFLGAFLRSRGSPSVSVSWIRQIHASRYRYLDAPAGLAGEQWTEVSDFFKVALFMGVSSF